MKAAIVPQVNGPWEIKDVPTPKIGADEVLVKMHASGICYSDVHETLGHLPGAFPRILGHEPVGEIVEIGAGVTTRKVGDRVGVAWVQHTCMRCEWCGRRKFNFCAKQEVTGIHRQGGHAEFMPMYESATTLIPDGVSYEQAAPIFCAGYTVWSGIRAADPLPGEKVGVLGVGGLGHLAIQYAKAAGYETYAISHSPDKDKLAKELGAVEVVKDGKALAAIGGVDILLNTSNSAAAMTDSLAALRPDGRFVSLGADAGTIALSPIDLIMRRLKIVGGSQNGAEYLYEALQWVAKGKVKVRLETYKLDEARKAYDRVAEGKARFRAVLAIQ